MKIKYEEDENINESSLNIYVYNNELARWQLAQPDETLVIRDTVNNEIIIGTSHLSLFIIGGTTTIPGPPEITSVSISPDKISPNNDGNYDNSYITTTISESGTIFVTIYDYIGNKIFSNSVNSKAESPATVVWDGRDINNKPVPSGVYFVQLQAGDKCSKPYKVLRLKAHDD